MVKRIIRSDEKRDQEETQDCQRSIPSFLDPRHSEQPSDFPKIQSPKLQRQCHTNPTSSTLFLSRYSFFFFLPGKQTSFTYYFLVLQTCFNKKETTFLLFVNNSFLYSLSCWTIQPLILPDRQKKIRLNCVNPTSCIFQTQRGHRKTLTKQTVGS